MSPQLIIEPHGFDRHPQRPWRPVERKPRPSAVTRARTYAVPVVRELAPHSVQQEPAGIW